MSTITDAVTGEKSFDLRTHIRDSKTGKTIKSQPYRMHVDRANGTIFERAGIKYFPDGSFVDPASAKRTLEARANAVKAAKSAARDAQNPEPPHDEPPVKAPENKPQGAGK